MWQEVRIPKRDLLHTRVRRARAHRSAALKEKRDRLFLHTLSMNYFLKISLSSSLLHIFYEANRVEKKARFETKKARIGKKISPHWHIVESLALIWIAIRFLRTNMIPYGA
jgi:hypothetical protein